jgi:hypothetical protein
MPTGFLMFLQEQKLKEDKVTSIKALFHTLLEYLKELRRAKTFFDTAIGDGADTHKANAKLLREHIKLKKEERTGKHEPYKAALTGIPSQRNPACSFCGENGSNDHHAKACAYKDANHPEINKSGKWEGSAAQKHAASFGKERLPWKSLLDGTPFKMGPETVTGKVRQLGTASGGTDTTPSLHDLMHMLGAM